MDEIRLTYLADMLSRDKLPTKSAEQAKQRLRQMFNDNRDHRAHLIPRYAACVTWAMEYAKHEDKLVVRYAKG